MNLQNIPLEIEQRWLVPNDSGRRLSSQAKSASLVIQGYVGLCALNTLQTGFSDIKKTIQYDNSRVPSTTSLQLSVDATILFAVEIPRDHAEQLLQDGGKLLDNMRIRVQQDMKTKEIKGYVTIKGKKVDGVGSEYKYEIPPCEAASALKRTCSRKWIRKTRYELEGGIELDHFPMQGMFIAEREVKDTSQMLKEIPTWAVAEITGNNKYSNFEMASADHLTYHMLSEMFKSRPPHEQSAQR